MGLWQSIKASFGVKTTSEHHSVTIKSTMSTSPGGDPGGSPTVMRDGVEVTDPAERAALLAQMRALTSDGADGAAAPVDAEALLDALRDDTGGHAHTLHVGPLSVSTTSSVKIIHDGVVSDDVDDPAVRAALDKALTQLRAEGLDGPAAELEQVVGAAGGGTPPAADPPPAAAPDDTALEAPSEAPPDSPPEAPPDLGITPPSAPTPPPAPPVRRPSGPHSS